MITSTTAMTIPAAELPSTVTLTPIAHGYG
jgi:hypothetical protein